MKKISLNAAIARSAILLLVFLLGAPSETAADPPEGGLYTTPYTTDDHRFPSGDLQLSGRLYAPKVEGRFPVLVLVSGSGKQSMIDNPFTQVLAKTFAEAGIGTFAYDKRGTGASGGRFTGSDFKVLGADAAAAVRFTRRLENVSLAGLWGISQAGWIIPYAMAEKPGARLAILVSPAGVNPFEQMEFFMHNQEKGWGLSEAEIAKADAVHRATTLCYAGRLSHEKAREIVDRHLQEPWFKKVVAHPYWHEMTADGRLLAATELADRIAAHPEDYEFYVSESTFADYARPYEALKAPTLVIYGAADEIVPVPQSRAILEPALRCAGTAFEVKVYEGADHGIQAGGRVRLDYLDDMAAWARARFDQVR